MGDIDKLVERICRRPPEARFDDVRRLLIAFGWSEDRSSGSHVMFVKAGERTIAVPKSGEKVKRVYLDQLCRRLGLDEE
jgi:predicted RNA binding protein YcfA (HicA-like mRNA interferase family)